MSNWAELDSAIEHLGRAGVGPLVVLQCTSAYPTAPESVGLNVLGEIRERYRCATGLSDRSGKIFPALGAVALGGRVVEVHVTLRRQMFGPDVAASVTSRELRSLVEGVPFLEAALGSPVDKDMVAHEMASMRTAFGRSLVACTQLPAGQVLAASDLTAKKPGGGIPAADLDALVGRRLRRPLDSDQPVSEDDVEPPLAGRRSPTENRGSTTPA